MSTSTRKDSSKKQSKETSSDVTKVVNEDDKLEKKPMPETRNAAEVTALVSSTTAEQDGTTTASSSTVAAPPQAIQSRPSVPKRKVEVMKAPGRQWVGDGFHVHGMFGYERGALARSPFLMMDYAQEEYFKPIKDGAKPRGVGTHPHKGFETVTICYQGEVEHRDNKGGGGMIGPGDCQWMTAGRGIQHSEFHSKSFSESGGNFEMIQLWINLPKKFKNTKPKYQSITAQRVVEVPLPEESGAVRMFAGTFEGKTGPAKTFTPMNVWNISLNKQGVANVSQPEGWTTMVAVLKGLVRVNGTDVNAHELIQLSNEGDGVRIEAKQASVLLLLAGEPIDEPIAGEGPFVMNTDAEVRQATADFKAGKF